MDRASTTLHSTLNICMSLHPCQPSPCLGIHCCQSSMWLPLWAGIWNDCDYHHCHIGSHNCSCPLQGDINLNMCKKILLDAIASLDYFEVLSHFLSVRDDFKKKQKKNVKKGGRGQENG